MKILLIDNHIPFVQVAIEQFLSEHEVITVSTLRDARQMARQHIFDAVLVDYDLDDGKGDEIVRELRAGAFGKKIVAISSHDIGNRKLTDAGADVTCSKVDFEKIGAILAKT